jgi:hypothetical protein
MLKPWVPPNASPAWAILVPERVQKQGLTYQRYKSLLTDKLASLIESRDPAETPMLTSLPFKVPEDPVEAAMEILAAVEMPMVQAMQTVVRFKEDRALEMQIREQALSEVLPEILAAM